jgi:spore coat protein U-like protein
MGKGAPLLIASFLCFASMASAAPITYDVTVNTSSISGTAGSLDFEFNPGPLVTQAADLQIINFTSNGTLAGSPALTGDVAGALPTTLTFDNGTAFNDYFEGFTYGSTLSIRVSLFGPALSSPDGTSTSGSTFAFSMFSDAAGTIPALTNNTTEGFAFTIGVNLDGTTTVTNFSPQTTVVPETVSVPAPSIGVGLPTFLTIGGVWFGAKLLGRNLTRRRPSLR